MTRDEAEQKLRELGVPRDIRGKYHIIEVLTALGILKLDEPKSVESIAIEIIHRHAGATYGQGIMMDLEAAGLKIVEK